MAAQADGIILINTAINKDGAIDDIGALKDALRELTTVVKELTTGLTNSLTGAGKQATKAADQIESISDSAKEAKGSVQSLKEQMDKISIDRGKQSSGEWDEESRISHARGEFQEYGNTVQQFVDDYASGMDKVDKSTNEFKNEISALSKQLKDLESQGLYFGDDQYDETYLKLAKIKQALADYKKEMLSPAESPKINMDSLQGQVDSLKRKLQQLSDQGKTFGDSLYDSTYQALNKAQAQLNGYKKDLTTPVEIPVELDQDSFAYQIQQLKAKLAELGKQGITLGNPEYDSTYAELQKVIQAEKEYKKSLLGTDQGQRQAKKSSDRMKKSLDKSSKSAKGARKEMSMLGMMGKSIIFSFVFKAISTITTAVTEGMQNISRYSASTNQAMSRLMSSLTTLKNSFAVAFAPVIEYVTPALTRLISKLIDANNWIAQTMAALAGKDTFVKAVAVQEDYAASLGDTQKAAKEAAKEIKKASFAFDTLIQAQKAGDSEAYKGPTPDQMFKTIAIGTEAKALAEDIKSTLSNLFQPLKASWDQYGPSTVAAVKTMFGSLKQLASDVGASFMQVWKDEGYGKAITDDLLITFSNFALTVANLADQFDKAWVNAGTGTSIMRHLGDLVLLVTGFFREASESIKNWAATLDFSPLLIAFDGLLASLIPVVSKIGDALLWLLNNVLLPVAKWALEKALPVALDLISAAFEVLNSVLDALQPIAIWLWEDFIKPIGEWTGSVIIGAIKGITEKLKEFSDWIKNNQGKVELITELVVAFFLAWKFTEFATGVQSMIDILSKKGLAGALTQIAEKLGIAKWGFLGVVGAMSALLVGAWEMYKNWDKMTPPEKFISTLLIAAGAAAALAVATHAVAGPAAAAAIGIAIASGLAAALLAINAGKRSSVSSASSGGGGRSYATSYSSAPYAAYSANMPRLATGTVVPPKAGEFAAILGDNNKDYEVVSPLGTIRQAVDEALDARGGLGGGGGSITVVMELDGTKFGQAVYKYNNKENQRVGVRMVTGG
jgi:archaellum component FlaC